MQRLIGTMFRRPRAAAVRQPFTSVTVLPVIQPLEGRRLLSVSAQTLVGPFSAGTTYTYKDSATGQFTDIIVVGPTTFSGQNVTEADTFTGPATPVPRTMPVKNYSTFDATGQYVQYGTIVTDASGNPSLTISYPTGNVLLPAQLAGGQTYTFYSYPNFTPDVGGGSVPPTPTPTPTPVPTPPPPTPTMVSVTLVSETLQSVTVPAGTFQAYQFNSTISIPLPGTSTASTTMIQRWVAPDVGVVKTVTQPASGSALTDELVSFSLGAGTLTLNIQADTAAIATAKATLKSTIAADRQAAAAQKATDQAAIAAVKAQMKLDRATRARSQRTRPTSPPPSSR